HTGSNCRLIAFPEHRSSPLTGIMLIEAFKGPKLQAYFDKCPHPAFGVNNAHSTV
ncbi:hypothetical protein Dimus_011837, partial [Dionaea muscipula]